MRKRPPISRIAIARGEHETGIRGDDGNLLWPEEPDCWQNACPKRRCPGIEIIRCHGAYCPMMLPDEECPQKRILVGQPFHSWRDNVPAVAYVVAVGIVAGLVIAFVYVWFLYLLVPVL